MNPQILIIDDDTNVRSILARCLSHEGYVVKTAANGAKALQMLVESAYDLLLLDLHIEPVNGLEVLKFARKKDPDLAVIIYTACNSLESAVEAFRLGAFDYLCKPVTPALIRQRVQEGLQHRQQALYQRQLISQLASLRRALDDLIPQVTLSSSRPDGPRFIHSGKLIIDRRYRTVTLDGSPLDLTTTEFDLLLCMVEAAPEPLSPRQIVNRAMGYDSEDLEARDITKWHIHQLRRKIEPDPAHPRYIKTVRLKGYMWRGEPAFRDAQNLSVAA